MNSDKNMSQRKIDGYLKLAKVIQWGRANPVKFVERIFGMPLLDYQKYVFMKSWYTPYVLWTMSRSAGKALSLDTKIPTPEGFKTMSNLNVGDFVYDENGEPTKIISTSEVFYNHECYEVEFDDGEKIIADSDHLWYVKTKHSEKLARNGRVLDRVSYRGNKMSMYDTVNSEGYIVLKTKDMVGDFFRKRKDGKGIEYKYRLPISKEVKYNHKELPIHPYVLGVWLGDGNSRDLRVTSHVDDYKELCKHIRECGYTTKVYDRNNSNIKAIGIDINKKNEVNETREVFRGLNLLENKHIPEDYLFSSVEQRYELLRGLMDTDGYCSRTKKYCEFSQKDYNLIKLVSNLLSSLGIKHNTTKRNTYCNNSRFESYRMTFSVDKSRSCFKLKRKHDLLPTKLPDKTRSKTKTIISIKKVKSVPTKCIMVDNPMHLFLCGEKYTITHNSTLGSPFIMAKSMLIPNFQAYILAGVGSQSQEMFMKIEKIAKREIASFTGLTDVFYNETVKSASNTDGFTHNPSSFQYKLYNGSIVNSLNGSFDNNRLNMVAHIGNSMVKTQ